MLYFLETDGLVDLFPAAGVPGPSGSRTLDQGNHTSSNVHFGQNIEVM